MTHSAAISEIWLPTQNAMPFIAAHLPQSDTCLLGHDVGTNCSLQNGYVTKTASGVLSCNLLLCRNEQTNNQRFSFWHLEEVDFSQAEFMLHSELWQTWAKRTPGLASGFLCRSRQRQSCAITNMSLVYIQMNKNERCQCTHPVHNSHRQVKWCDSQTAALVWVFGCEAHGWGILPTYLFNTLLMVQW